MAKIHSKIVIICLLNALNLGSPRVFKNNFSNVLEIGSYISNVLLQNPCTFRYDLITKGRWSSPFPKANFSLCTKMTKTKNLGT